MKQIITFLSFMSAMLIGQPLYAHDFEVNGIYYGYNTSTNTAYVTYADDDKYSSKYAGELSIPSTVSFKGRTMNVTAIGEWAFYKCSKLTKVTLSDNITSIGNCAFWSCNGLQDIIIPNSVTTIGDYGFYECENLEVVHIGNSLQSIGSNAFSGCENLISINLPRSLTTIYDRAFLGCESLTSITLPSSLRTMETAAFYRCYSLTNLIIEDGLTEIPENAFKDCKRLLNVDFPSSITYIGSSAFSGCTDMTRVFIPKNVTVVSSGAFMECPNIKSIIFEDGNPISIGYNAFIDSYPESLYIGRDIDGHGFETGDGHYSTVAGAIKGSELKIVGFGENVKKADMREAKKLEKIYSKSTRPFSCSFDSKTYVNATLYVPDGAKSDYEIATGWKDFWTIEEKDVSLMWDGSGDDQAASLTVSPTSRLVRIDSPTPAPIQYRWPWEPLRINGYFLSTER